jgi:HAD superfamily hydrolase (TIGR01549 family)
MHKIKRQIKKYQIISFDIFDTLLVRPYVKPSDLFLHLEKLNSKNGFAKLRVSAEIDARRKYSNMEEVTFNQIYNELDTKYQYMKEKELELEKKTLIPNPKMLKLYNYALELGKQVIIVSDMYLPKDFLEKILVEKGFFGYSKFYLSSDIMKTKHTSSLYWHIINDLKINPKSVLHIGDNYQSDYKMAMKVGFSSYHCPKPIDILVSKNFRSKIFMEQNNTLGTSIILGLIAIKNLKEPQISNYWVNFGYVYAGPLILAYAKWLNKKFQEDKIRDALFIARDGYTLQKVFDIIKNTDVKSHYVYASRIISLMFKLDKLTAAEIEKLLPIIKKDENLKANISDISKNVDFIKDNFEICKIFSYRLREEYKEYINNLNIDEKNVGIVDTVSQTLSAYKIMRLVKSKDSIKSYYWFITENTRKHAEFDENSVRCFQFEEYQLFSNWSIVEFFMTAPEPPIKYILKNTPIYVKPSKDEKVRLKVYPYVSEGAVEFAIDSKNIFGDLELFIDAKTIKDYINILCQHPTKLDKKKLKIIKHAADLYHSKYTVVLSSWYSKNRWDKVRCFLLRFIQFLKNKFMNIK